jgi:hypothetical protein
VGVDEPGMPLLIIEHQCQINIRGFARLALPDEARLRRFYRFPPLADRAFLRANPAPDSL